MGQVFRSYAATAALVRSDSIEREMGGTEEKTFAFMRRSEKEAQRTTAAGYVRDQYSARARARRHSLPKSAPTSDKSWSGSATTGTS